MTQDRQILDFISRVRDSHPQMVQVYTEGSCLNFHYILRFIWPKAVAYTNIDHVITRIGDKYYDITGRVYNTDNYSPLGTHYNKRAESKAYNKRAESKAYKQQMYGHPRYIS